jgi:hypothetical protein
VIVICVNVQIQAVNALGIETRSISRRDESVPFGGVIPGIAVVQAGVVIVVIATVTDGGGVGDRAEGF